jgi:hypothetical protein
MLASMNAKRLASVFLIGGIGGAICDQIHVQSQTTVYENPVLFGLAWTAPLAFGTGILAGFIVAQPFARKTYPAEPPALRRMIIDGVLFFAAYFASAALHPQRDLAAAILWGTFAARVLLTPKPQRAHLASYALIAGAGGAVIEAVLSALGSFHYVGSDIFGIPLWLPALYAHAAPLGLALARHFPIQRADRSPHPNDGSIPA